MDIHVVQPGDTLYTIALRYGVPMSRLLQDNQPPDPARLVVGQTLVIQYPLEVYTVRENDTLSSISRSSGISVRQLLRNNPILQGQDRIVPGQELVLRYRQQKEGTLSVNGYAYPNISSELLHFTLPYLTSITPFTYGFTAQGELVVPEDVYLVDAAKRMGVRPLLHLSTLTADGGFSNELAHIALTDGQVQNRLLANLLQVIQTKGYQGLDVDFEFVYASDAQAYARFVGRLREALAPLGLPVIVALAPKTSADQPGQLYEGHDYALLSQAADYVFLMTYEWGYTYNLIRYM